MRSFLLHVCFAMFALILASTTFAENYIGVIIDGYQKDCTVRSREENYDCEGYRLLYAGDIITKKPSIKSVQIKWAPYASGKEMDRTSTQVVFEPPKDRKGVLQRTKELLGLMKTAHRMEVGASRGGFLVVPQPGSNASLISGEKTTFSWNDQNGKYIIFGNSSGREIFRKELKGESYVDLSPEDIGMSAGETYTWYISGSGSTRQNTIRVLPQGLAIQVLGDLAQIDKGSVSGTDKLIEKSLYLQFISDAYPQDMDLYWLSYRLIKGILAEEIPDDDTRAIAAQLKNNYLRRVRERT